MDKMYSRVECGIFFWSDRTGQVTKGGMILEVQIQNFSPRACASKFSFSKNSRGLKYQYFFLKIRRKLPFTIKYNRRNTNFKFEFQNYLIFTPEKALFWFLKKNTQKKFFLRVRLWFSFKNNKHTIVILFGIFENAPKKSY